MSFCCNKTFSSPISILIFSYTHQQQYDEKYLIKIKIMGPRNRHYGLLLHCKYYVLWIMLRKNTNIFSFMEGKGRTLRALGCNHAQLAMFLQTLNRFLTHISHEHV